MATETVQTFENGVLVDSRVEEVPPERFNRDSKRQKLQTARQAFRDNYANWAAMNNAQKDQANRNAQRALANLIGHVLDDATDAGD